VVGAGATVEQTVGRDAEIGERARVGPFAVLEPGSHIPSETSTGSFYTATSDDTG
jgi:bifunctional UDP-N-acetylglucosamine pyrophosphorylase/glucosamine-1-phosphate N-acetyltransferase